MGQNSIGANMLYAKVGAKCPDDPYDVAGFLREDQKKAILAVINANDRKKSVHSLRRKGVKNAAQLCDALIERHQPIAEYFFTGIGTELQFQDSQVAELVMLKIAKLGGIALPVHDSFIVRVGREDELETAMNEAFQEIYPGIAPKHKRKVDLLELRARNSGPGDEFQFVSNDIPAFSESDWQRIRNIHS